MHERFERRIDEALEKVLASCEKREWKKEVIDRRVGKIMAKNSRAAGLGDEPRRIFEELGKSAWSTSSSQPVKRRSKSAAAV